MLPLKNVDVPALFPSFFGKKWKTFVMYWWFVFFMFWNSVLGVAARTNLFVVDFEDSSWSPCFQESEFWAFSCGLRTFDFWALGGPHKFPCASLTTLSFVGIPRVDWISKILRRILPRAPRTALHQVDGSRLRWNHWFWFRRRWTFTGSRF